MGMGLSEKWGKWVVMGINKYKKRKKKKEKNSTDHGFYHLRSLAVFSRWKVTGMGLNENWGKQVVTNTKIGKKKRISTDCGLLSSAFIGSVWQVEGDRHGTK